MPKKIDPALKVRAVRLVAEHRAEYSSLTAAAAVVAKQCGVAKETVRRWALPADIDAGARERKTSEELAEGRGPPAGGGQRDLESGGGLLRRELNPRNR